MIVFGVSPRPLRRASPCGDTAWAMSREVVRKPVTVGAQSRPSIEERLILPFPRFSEFLIRALGRLWDRLPSRSRLRKAILRRYIRVGFDAINRDDFEAVAALYHPNVEFITPPELAGLGFDARIHGLQERIRVQRTWNAEWGGFRFEPKEIIDPSDGRVILIGRVRGSGLASQAAVENEWGNILTISAGKVIREEPLFSHREALEAAGLRE